VSLSKTATTASLDGVVVILNGTVGALVMYMPFSLIDRARDAAAEVDFEWFHTVWR
jgi:hypothetical protein